MTQFLQNLIDGAGLGGTYALLAIGISLIFGVMHLVNFAHGELITFGAYTAYFLFKWFDASWWWMPLAIIVSCMFASVLTERIAFRWVRNANPFTMLLTSFALERLSHALWQIFVSPKAQAFPKTSWAFNTFTIGGLRLEVMDIVTIVVTVLALAGTALVFKQTLFGIAVRGAAEDFDAARLMGVKANRVILGAFAYAGLLAGVAAVLILIRTPSAKPDMGSTWLLAAIIAAVLGGMGSFTGAVVGGLMLGLLQTFFQSYLPEGTLSYLNDAFVFAVIAIVFVVRPQGLFNVTRAERV
jgi:branched-chain amino acid transport system permease protein